MTSKDWSAFRSSRYLNNANFHNNGHPTAEPSGGDVSDEPYWTNGIATLHRADAREIPLPDKSVHCVVTSPPYWGLRDYGLGTWQGGDAECGHEKRRNDSTPRVDGGTPANNNHAAEGWVGGICGHCGATQQAAGIGLEPTLGEWVANIVAVGREVHRVLRDDGTFWLNLGDAYAGGGRGSGSEGSKQKTSAGSITLASEKGSGLPAKNLQGQPWRAAFALQDAGWILRSAIVWHKPNPMPESVTDRPTNAYEMLFLLAKQGRYFYDAEAVREPYAASVVNDKRGNANGHRRERGFPGSPANGGTNLGGNGYSGANARNVWQIPTQGRPDAHFATFPDELPRRCILAGTSERGVCGECGAPWSRQIEKTIEYSQNTSNNHGSGKELNSRAANWSKDGYLPGNHHTQTLGWQPTCGCGATCDYCKAMAAFKAAHDEWESINDAYQYGWNDYEPTDAELVQPEPPDGECSCNRPAVVPAVVLDPFVGSGTSCAVAQQLGRRSVGLDLNPDYLEIARRRIERVSLSMPLG